MEGRDAERGQATLELIASIPLLLAAAAVVLQLLAVGYAQSLADGAAEAGAIAVGAGRSADPAVRQALPGWAARRVEVDVDGGGVEVSLQPPSLLPRAAEALRVEGSAWARRPLPR
jgi:hypothetical protein